ncbi:signal peptidase II [Pseudoroseomonas sp. WGS1072]|uniref:signal peptidase II n=1 Tax=Roseomonas sp. WGS1072 TaxID=3366816 RepID=UPI003BF10AC8
MSGLPGACRPALIFGLPVAGVALLLDQVSKAWALAALWPPHLPYPVTPFFNLRLGFNTGVSFGMFAGGSAASAWVLSAVCTAVAAGLLVWMWRSRSRREAAGLGLVTGGALGNIVDRIRQGAVTDFLDFHVAGYHWPTFNIADTAIFVGVALVLLVGRRGARAPAPASATHS